MKRVIAVLFCGIFVCTNVFSQEKDGSKAFNHLSVGLEFLSTTGFGIELATPLSSRFALRGGISMFPYRYTLPINVKLTNNMINKMDDAMLQDPTITSELEKLKLPVNPRNISTDIDATASLGLINGKLLLDFYPMKNGSFHLTGGLYIGAGKLVKIEGKMQEAYDVLRVMKKNGYDFFNDEFIDGSNILAKDIMNLNGAIGINSVKPYFGLGFGRAVPKRRVGFCMELGAFYQGNPKLSSENANIQKLIDNNLSDVTELLQKISIYPVLSFKLNVKIF